MNRTVPLFFLALAAMLCEDLSAATTELYMVPPVAPENKLTRFILMVVSGPAPWTQGCTPVALPDQKGVTELPLVNPVVSPDGRFISFVAVLPASVYKLYCTKNIGADSKPAPAKGEVAISSFEVVSRASPLGFLVRQMSDVQLGLQTAATKNELRALAKRLSGVEPRLLPPGATVPELVNPLLEPYAKVLDLQTLQSQIAALQQALAKKADLSALQLVGNEVTTKASKHEVQQLALVVAGKASQKDVDSVASTLRTVTAKVAAQLQVQAEVPERAFLFGPKRPKKNAAGLRQAASQLTEALDQLPKAK